MQDFLTTKLIKLRGARIAHWAVLAPAGRAVFFAARWVKPLPGGKERLPEMYQKVFDRPAWRAARESLPIHTIPLPDAQQPPALPEPPESTDALSQTLLPEVLPAEDEDDGWE